MRHSHELRRFLARQTDSQDAPIDRGEFIFACFAMRKSKPFRSRYAFLHKTAIKLAKDHRRHRSAWLRRTIVKPRTGERHDPKHR
jgi:hypothetical protein